MTTNLTAGQSYTVTARVTNKSTKSGQPVGAQLSVSLAAVVGSTTIASGQQSYAFAANESHDFTFPIDVPVGASGAGVITAAVLSPTGTQLASASLNISILSLASEAAPIVFTSATISPFAVQAQSGWWGTSYYGIAQMTINWNAAHRVPEVDGSGNGSIQVSWQLTKGAATVQGSYSTTPQAVDSAGKYYFPPGAGSVGWPYAGMQVPWADVNPERGVWNYIVSLKAYSDGILVGEANFQGTVAVT